MGKWDWQLAVTLLCVALAVGVLVRRMVLLMSRRKVGGCGSGCGSCPSPDGGLRGKAIVPLDLSATPRGEGSRDVH